MNHRFAAALVAAVVLAACSKTETTSSSSSTGGTAQRVNGYTQPHELRIGDNQDISTLNPHIGTSTSLGNLSQLTMAYLVRYGADNRPVPELATEVPTQKNGLVSKDGLTITWHLRKNVKWSDGQPFDGDDIVFSTNAVNNTANNEVGRDGWDLIKKIDEPDKYTVIFHLSKPYSGFLPTFFGSAGANPCILPKHILGKLPNFNNAPYNSLPIGIGPFRYVKWVRGDRVELEPNPYWWGTKPKLERVVYKIIPDRNTLLTQMQTGEIDLWPYAGAGYVDRLKALSNATLYSKPGYYYAHIDFNTTRPQFKDPRVRLALQYGTDRAPLLEKIGHGAGVLSESQLTPVSPMHTDQPLLPYDPKKANQILDEAGWKRGSDGIRAKDGVALKLTWAAPTGNQDADQQIELVRQNWQQLGVSFVVTRSAPALYFGPYSQGGVLYTGKWDVTAFSWGMTPDADYTPQNNCDGIPPKGQNVTRLCDSRIQALLLQEKAAYDEPDRKTIIAKLDQRLAEVKPYFVQYIRNDNHAYNKDLKGFAPNAVTPFDGAENWDI